MRKSRDKVRNQVLGPRALAVISCALALLAAQPAARGAERGRETVASLKVAGGEYGIEKSEFKVEGRERAATVSFGEGERAGMPASRRLHILATVEMLQRLLAFELRPVEGRVVAALVLNPVPVAVELVLAPPYRNLATGQDCRRELPYEQRMAIERHLLAPPFA